MTKYDRKSKRDCKRLIEERKLPYSIIRVGPMDRLIKDGELVTTPVTSFTLLYKHLDSLPYDSTHEVDDLLPSNHDKKGFYHRFLEEEFDRDVFENFIKFMDGRDVMEDDGEVVYHIADVKEFCEKNEVLYPYIEEEGEKENG